MKNSRIGRATCALMLSMMVSMWLAPAAHAQLDGAVGDAVGGVEDTLGGGGSAPGTDSGGIIGGVTDGLEGGSNDSGSDGGTSGGGGLIGDTVDKVDDTVDETLDSGKGTVEEVTNDTGGSLGNVGTGLVGTVEETTDKVKNDLTGTGKKRERNTGSNNRKDTSSTTGEGSDVLAHGLAGALQADAKALDAAIAEGQSFAAAPVSATTGDSIVSQIGRIASEAVQQVAFPLALILLVIGFLMVQNRIDSKDPKLALAPVDSEHDLLSFT